MCRLLCIREDQTVLNILNSALSSQLVNFKITGSYFWTDKQKMSQFGELCYFICLIDEERKFTLINIKPWVLLVAFDKLNCLSSLFDKFNLSRNTYSIPDVFVCSYFIQSLRYITGRNEIQFLYCTFANFVSKISSADFLLKSNAD